MISRQTAHMRRRSGQDGYMLLVIMLLVFVMMMATVRVATSLAQDIRRQREIEMIHRGTQ